MDIPASALAHLAFGVSSPSRPAGPSPDEATQDAAAWFQGDASGTPIRLSAGLPDTTDVAALAQRVLAHLNA